MEEVSFREVIRVLRERLDERLSKARIYPDLLHACLPAARRLKAFQTLEKHGAKLFLLDKDIKPIYSAHPIPEKSIKLFALCEGLGFHSFALPDKQLFAETYTPYNGKMVAVHLGEWRPFIPFGGEPLEMSGREFLKTYWAIQRYLERLKRFGVSLALDWRMERVREDRPVFLTTNSLPEGHYLVGYTHRYTQYYLAYTEKTEEDIKREQEERRRQVEEMSGAARKFEALLSSGKVVGPAKEVIVSEVSPEAVESVFGIRIGGVARRVLVVKSRLGLLDHTGIRITMPISYLHALRYLEAAGINASLVRPSWLAKSIDFGFRLGIAVLEHYDSYYYAVVVLPKRAHQLPPIKLAKVLKSSRRIVVVA